MNTSKSFYRRGGGICFTIILCLASLLIGCKSSDSKKSGQVTGAGASLPQPFYQLAFKHFQDSVGISVNYGAIGSGGGIRSLKDKVTDFGATDAFLSSDEMKEFDDSIVHIPTCMAAIVLAYNIEGVDQLNLNHDIITKIYLGKITMWNDSSIKAINPEIELPDLAITPVYRSDGSGSTYVFSYYLSSVNEEWANTLGKGKALQWQTGVAGKGNPGVAGIISQTPGAIGYLGSEYAFSMQLASANIQNAAGQYIHPEIETIAAAGDQTIPTDTRTMITNAPGEKAYPICCFTWIILYREQNYNDRSLDQAENTLRLMHYLMGEEAQGLTESVHYVRLPEKAHSLAVKQLETITYKGKKIEL